jgi:hypothetical protein
MMSNSKHPSACDEQMPSRLATFFFVNAIFTFPGGVGLIFFGEKVTYGIQLAGQTTFLFRLLGSTAFSLSALSFYARQFSEFVSIQAAIVSFLIFHGLTAIVGVFTLFSGISRFVAINAIVHILFFALFYLFGSNPYLKRHA